MAKDKEVIETKSIDGKDFLETREQGKVFSYSTRKKVTMLKGGAFMKEGQEYDLHSEKADYLIEKGLAKEVK